MKHFIGIDNSSLDHKVRIIDENGNLKESFTVENSFSGFEELHARLAGVNGIKIGFELPHGPLIDYLHAKGYQQYSINPLKIKRFKESLKVSGNKNDDIDALAIAEYLKRNSTTTRELLYDSPVIERLKTLSVIHTRLTHNRTRHLNKLHFSVRQCLPLHESLFTDFGCKTQLKMLLKYPTYQHLRSTSDEDIRSFLIAHRYRKNKYIDRVLSRIRNHRQLISPDVEYAYQFETECLCKIILTIDEKLGEIEEEMREITESHRLGKYFSSLPGAGKILSCKLLAIFGDNKDRFNDYNGVQCFFGTAPRNYQSGKYHKVMMRRACNKAGRAILYQFAHSSLNFSKWSREYYDQQRARGKTNSVALRALSNKWVRVIFRIWKDEIFYEESKKIAPAA